MSTRQGPMTGGQCQPARTPKWIIRTGAMLAGLALIGASCEQAPAQERPGSCRTELANWGRAGPRPALTCRFNFSTAWRENDRLRLWCHEKGAKRTILMETDLQMHRIRTNPLKTNVPKRIRFDHRSTTVIRSWDHGQLKPIRSGRLIEQVSAALLAGATITMGYQDTPTAEERWHLTGSPENRKEFQKWHAMCYGTTAEEEGNTS